MSGLQCAKRLYLEVHQPELAEISSSQEQRFAVGYEVGEMARKLNPGGTLIGVQEDLQAALRETETALGAPGDTILYEPCFAHGKVLVRADILARRQGKLHMTEVKASTEVKEHHFNDVAIQAWVMEGAGFTLDRIFIDHINKQFVYKGNGNYKGLFTREEVTDAVEGLLPQVPEWIVALRKYLAGEIPDIPMGKQCNTPFECPFQTYCSKDLPEFPLSLLPSGGQLIKKLEKEGFIDLRDVPEERLDKPHHLLIHRAVRMNQGVIDPKAADVLKEVPFPRFYLDFETIQFAVPIWTETRPYQQLPFQWSCHVENAPGKLEHFSFLDLSGEAPMRGFAERLIATLGKKGGILVYSHFEQTILRGLGERFPDLADNLQAIVERLVDLHPIAKAHYYHPALDGSWSLKVVLPAIVPELDYENLAIQGGGMAQAAYLEAIYPDTSSERKKELEEALREYCAQDTLGLTRIVDYLVSSA